MYFSHFISYRIRRQYCNRPITDFTRISLAENHLNRCAALLNMFLMATYGEGQYVEAYYTSKYISNPQADREKATDLLLKYRIKQPTS